MRAQFWVQRCDGLGRPIFSRHGRKANVWSLLLQMQGMVILQTGVLGQKSPRSHSGVAGVFAPCLLSNARWSFSSILSTFGHFGPGK